LERLVNDQRVSLAFPIQKRVKTWDSIADKLERQSLLLSHLTELKDLVGLRLILQFRRDVGTVCDLIRKHFTVLDQYDTQDRLREDQFGYSSYHFVVALPQPWLAVPTLADMKELTAEIQIRTTAQHIWAAASHTLQYKHEASVPPPLKRALYRVSALLEAIDLEFERFLEERDVYREDVDVSETQTSLNVDTLEKLLDSLLPEANKRSDEGYAELLEDLRHFNISTPEQLKSMVRPHLVAVQEQERSLAAEFMKEPATPALDPERLARGIVFYHVGLVRKCLSLALGKDWDNYLRERYSPKFKPNKPEQ
jgi:ppGpp synthetase/RelA/SpoT-type nucleotidyltranferase